MGMWVSVSDSLKKIEIGSYLYDRDDGKWDVRLNEDTYFSCQTQFEAEILSRLVRIEAKLNPHGDVGSEIQTK